MHHLFHDFGCQPDESCWRELCAKENAIRTELDRPVTRPVLLGGRTALRVHRQALWGMAVWLPVVLALLVIARESTNGMGAEYTSGPLRHLFQWIFGPVSPERWVVVHHYMRKTGHFVGYGLTGLTFLRAWMHWWLGPLRLRSAAWWRTICFTMAVCCTAFVASMDEVHQSYLPDRTGLVSDIGIDTAGASTLMLLLALFWISRSPRAKLFSQ